MDVNDLDMWTKIGLGVGWLALAIAAGFLVFNSRREEYEHDQGH